VNVLSRNHLIYLDFGVIPRAVEGGRGRYDTKAGHRAECRSGVPWFQKNERILNDAFSVSSSRLFRVPPHASKQHRPCTGPHEERQS
jgi:hypothetical protein